MPCGNIGAEQTVLSDGQIFLVEVIFELEKSFPCGDIGAEQTVISDGQINL